MLLVTLHYTKADPLSVSSDSQALRLSGNSGSIPICQSRDRLEGRETNSPILYGLKDILMLQVKLFPSSGFLQIMPLRGCKDLVTPRYSRVPGQLAYTLHFPWTQFALLPSQANYINHHKQNPHGA